MLVADFWWFSASASLMNIVCSQIQSKHIISLSLSYGVIFGTMFKNLSLVAKTDMCALVSVSDFLYASMYFRFGKLNVRGGFTTTLTNLYIYFF